METVTLYLARIRAVKKMMTINYYFNVQTSEVSVVRELKKFAG